MRLDHFVVHVDSAETPSKVAPEVRRAGFPFDPSKGKGDKGFKATNIWIGREYFEITWLLNRKGGAWIPEWVERYNSGARGIVCLFLRTEHLDRLVEELSSRNVKHRIERTSFKVFFGLFTVKLPWRTLLLPPIPGTNLEISFIQYDPGVSERFAKRLKPNSNEKGITGVHTASIFVPDLDSARSLIQGIFPNAENEERKIRVPLEEGSIEFSEAQGKERVLLLAKTQSPEIPEGKFQIEDVVVKTNYFSSAH